MSTQNTAIIKLAREDFHMISRASERGLTKQITSINCGDTFDIHFTMSSEFAMANLIQYVIWDQYEYGNTDGLDICVVDSEGNQSESAWDLLGEEYSVDNVQKKFVDEFLLKKVAVA